MIYIFIWSGQVTVAVNYCFIVAVTAGRWRLIRLASPPQKGFYFEGSDRKFPGSVFSPNAPVVEFLRFLLFGVWIWTVRGLSEADGPDRTTRGPGSERRTEPDQERARLPEKVFLPAKFSRS